ncbi:MAG: L-2-amino-thiazoline-4-carboxylic acid hydrolase [Desulforhopalus sp.]
MTKMVSVEEAASQVKVVAIRLALMHLAYARTLVEELDGDQAKDIIIKAMMTYGQMIGERNKKGEQDLPYYGMHEKYSYKEQEFRDTRDMPSDQSGEIDFDSFKVYGCVLSQIFKEYDEAELGSLYCFVDAAKTMAAESTHKLIHTACEVCGDDHCAFKSEATTVAELRMFEERNSDWKNVDPILATKRKHK